MTSTVKFRDVVNGYVYLLFGFFAHLYIIFSSSIYFSLEYEFHHHMGIKKETVISYFAILSILLLLFSLYRKWTWPFKVEEMLIVIFIWILLRNVLPKDCACCHPPPPKPVVSQQQQQLLLLATRDAPTLSPQEPSVATMEVHPPPALPPEEDEDCDSWQNSTLLYSILCVCVVVSSFLMNARDDIVSMGFTVTTIVLVTLTTLIPVSCNQLNQRDINTNLLKFTLYSIVWFLNKRMRLTERVLSMQYLKSIRILYTYDDYQHNHLLCGVRHVAWDIQKKKKTSVLRLHKHQHYGDECDTIASFIKYNDEETSLIPRPLFNNLDTLCGGVIAHYNPTTTSRHYHNRTDDTKARNFACQLRNLQKIQRIHQRHNHFFSWKHRLYDSEIQNIFDLTKTLWILNVCPLFLLFVFVEYLLLNYYIHRNIKELILLIQRVKVMRHIKE